MQNVLIFCVKSGIVVKIEYLRIRHKKGKEIRDMGERQVKKSRKNHEEVKPKHTAGKADVITNAVIAVVIAGVLGLGVYAVGSKYIERHASDNAAQTAQNQPTVADYIAEKGMTFDEFKSEYGITDESVTESSLINEVTANLTLDNYAKYSDMTLDELKSKYGLGNDVPESTLWQDAIGYMTTGTVAQNFGGTDFETFKTQMGLPDTITEATPWSETEAVLTQMSQQAQASSGDNAASTAENNQSAGE